MKPMMQAGDRAPFEQLRKARVVGDVDRDVLRRRAHQHRLFFGHDIPLCGRSVEASITRRHAAPQALNLSASSA